MFDNLKDVPLNNVLIAFLFVFQVAQAVVLAVQIKRMNKLMPPKD